MARSILGSNASQPSDEEARWKSKYGDLVKESAVNDEQYEEQLDLMRFMVARLSATAMGLDADLDSVLRRLKPEIQSDSVTRELAEVIRELDQVGQGVASKQRKLLSTWASLLDDIAAICSPLFLAAEHKEQLKGIREALSEAGSSAEQLECAQNLCMLLEEGRVASDAHDSLCEIDEQGELEQKQEAKVSEPAFVMISDRIEATLYDMINMIDAPESVKQSKIRIKTALQRGLNWYELIATLEELGLLVAGTLSAGDKEYRNFLKQTLQGLVDVQMIAKACVDVTQEAEQHCSELDFHMKEHVSEVKTALSTVSTIAQLKSQVSLSMDSIAVSMQGFNEAQSDGSRALKKQLGKLKEQVNSLQKEALDTQAQLEQQKTIATTDPLTRLPNRAAYDERVALEFKRWERYQRPLCLVVGDIDWFKRVNDAHGHLAGDDVLRLVSKSLKSQLRQTDFIARYGGEEMVLLLPETPAHNALLTSNKLREKIEQCVFSFDDEVVRITMSFGVAEFVPGDDIDSVFARADKALYVAKERGRNRCILA